MLVKSCDGAPSHFSDGIAESVGLASEWKH